MRRGLRGVRRGPGLLGTMARTAVVAGTASAVAGRVSAGQQAAAHREHEQAEAQRQWQAAQQQAEVQAQVAAALAQQGAAPVAPAAPAASPSMSTDDVLAQLAKLGELRAAGILTEEEFAAKKSQILGL